MDTFWLLIIVTALYWLGCAGIGVLSYKVDVKKPADFFLAGRGLGPVVLSLAMMATVFSAWFILGHQGMTYLHGFPYIAHFAHIPLMGLIGVCIFGRQWAVGRRFEFVTPGEMFGAYYGGELVRILVVLIACLYAVPYIALQLRGAGYVFNILSGDQINPVTGGAVLGIVVILYVFLGGLKAAAVTDTLQGVLLLIGAALLAVTAVGVVAGLAPEQGFLYQWHAGFEGLGDKYITLPDIGSAWSWPYIASIAFATFGIYASPSFTMWSFSASSPRIFKFQALFIMVGIMGLMYYVFTAAVGIGGRSILPALENTDALSLELIFRHMSPIPFVITALGILAAMNSTAAAYLANTSTILARDVYTRYVNPDAHPKKQILIGRIGVLLLVCVAVLFSSVVLDYLVLLGTLATSFGLLLFIPILGVTYLPGITRAGVNAGLIGGIIAVLLCYFVWRHPFGIHVGGWGWMVQTALTFIVSLRSEKVPADRVRAFHGLWDKDIASGKVLPDGRG
ncbi:MAG: sodium:solute symporter family protein [Desulfovibrio sp.]|nr:sodium:solute symporter family protein [Desulfovibrio sp.]